MPESDTFDIEALIRDSGDQVLGLVDEHINPAFARVLRMLGFDVNYTRGQGAYLWDDRGDRYIDCLSGFGMFACGRNHPTIRRAIRQAMDLDLPNLPKFGPPRLSGLLARKLVEIAPGALDTVFFCNSGSEGIETAIKYARAATARRRIVYCDKAFHGLTLGALSINGSPDFRDGFGELLEGCTAIPFNDPTALEAELVRGDVAAFIVEPIQGKGVQIPDDHYLPAAADLCRRHGALLVADEVQTGFGRTGRMFACEHWDIEPDILVAAKALSGGYVPVGAVLSKRWIHKKVFSTLDRCLVHSSTFGQNDLAMAAGLATLHVLETERLVERAAKRGDQLMSSLTALVDRYELVKDVRGKGLMIGIQFGPPKSVRLKMGWTLLHKIDPNLFSQAILIPLLKDHHVLAQVAGHHMDVIKLLPPLVLDDADVEHVAAAIDHVVAACHRFPGPVWEVGKRLGQQVFKGEAKAVEV